MSKIPLRVRVEAEIMHAREESSHPSRSELVRIRRLEKLVMLLADVIDRMNENQNKTKMTNKETPIEVERAEIFGVMPTLRWIERDEIIETDLEGNTITAKTIKVLQQLHFGDMGTELWKDVPTTKQLTKTKMSNDNVTTQWEKEYEKCKDPVYFYSNYLMIRNMDGTLSVPPPLSNKDKEDMRRWVGYNKPKQK